jgi:hypothetical protein
MDQLLTVLLSGAVGGVLTAAATLAGVWLHSRENLKRVRLELATREKQHQRDLRARFMDYLMKPRVEAHVDVLTRLWVLRSATARYVASGGEENLQEYILAKKEFDAIYVLNSAWLRPQALEELSALSREIEQLVSAQPLVSAIQQRFSKPIQLVQWSLGVEDLEQYIQDLSSEAGNTLTEV